VPDFRLDFKIHAAQEFPKEACGVIVDGKYWRCRNIADDPTEDFVLDPRDYAMASFYGKIEGIVHSHPRGGIASAVDHRSCSQTDLPWYIWSMPDDKWITIEP
jgi:proteasome lid subunit RPN8/RPN11